MRRRTVSPTSNRSRPIPIFAAWGWAKQPCWKAIRRRGLLGAEVAYVGSDQQFYHSLRFKQVYNSKCWLYYFD